MPDVDVQTQTDSPKLNAADAETLEHFRHEAERVAAEVRRNGGDLEFAFVALLKQAKKTPVYSYVLQFCGMKCAALVGIPQGATPAEAPAPR